MGAIIAIVVGVGIVIFGVLALAAAPHPGSTGPTVNITGLDVTSPDDACGLRGDDAGTIYLHPSGGTIPYILFGAPGPTGSVPCTVENVSTTTPGFTVFGSFPETVTTFPGSVVVSFIPPESFSGVLNISFG